jgi:predicted enzyme related to lactoylglutathione lyase
MTMGSPVTQFQILSKKPDDTAAFYSTLFGWTISANNPMGYRQIDTGSREGIQGGIWPAPPQAPDFVQLFVSVEDVKTAVEKALAIGAKVLIPPTVLPEGDEMAVLLDPNGLSFAVWRKSSR